MEVVKRSQSMERTSQTIILVLVLIIIGSEILILHYNTCKEYCKNAMDNLINLNECYLVVLLSKY